MKKKFLLFVVVCFMLLLSSCGSKNDYIENSQIALGTYCSIKIYGNEDTSILDECFARIDEIEEEMSLNIDNSEINMINKNAGINPVKVSDDTLYVIEKGKYYSEESKGSFDITIGKLSMLWNISGGNTKVPKSDEISETLSKVDYSKLILDKDNKEVYLQDKEMELDLGGIAKGYAADEVLNILKNRGVESAIINLGGNVYALGEKLDGSRFKVGIQDPFYEDDEYVGIIEVKDKSVITSGIYERYFEEDGVIYHHILDTKTGYPIDNSLLSVTIIGDSSIDGDSLSTLVFSYGLDKGYDYVNSLSGVEAIFITKDKKIYLTNGFEDEFQLSDENYNVFRSR